MESWVWLSHASFRESEIQTRIWTEENMEQVQNGRLNALRRKNWDAGQAIAFSHSTASAISQGHSSGDSDDGFQPEIRSDVRQGEHFSQVAEIPMQFQGSGLHVRGSARPASALDPQLRSRVDDDPMSAWLSSNRRRRHRRRRYRLLSLVKTRPCLTMDKAETVRFCRHRYTTGEETAS